ncbi:MAG: hypothetical protein M0Q38_17035 [Bacteroidales bacterium]|nr:hypothetical protein [Bacteroidales bacterium]
MTFTTRTAADTLFTTMLMTGKQISYNDTAWHISHCMGTSLMVHGYGDEDKALEDTALIGQTARRYGAPWLPDYCDFLWTDKIPKDNSLTIQLKSGISTVDKPGVSPAVGKREPKIDRFPDLK